MTDSAVFVQFIRSLPLISPAEEALILNSFRLVRLKSKEYLIREGEICKQIGYVQKGCFSYFRLLESGKKSIIHFAFEDWWTGDLESFLRRTPATTYWQALEDSELICVSRENFEILMRSSPAFEALFTMKTQTAYLKTMERLAKDKSETAEEKYLRLLREYPQILQRVPHYDVAAYLGIAPESLSRIRNKLARSQ